jgi:hypothetical protein
MVAAEAQRRQGLWRADGVPVTLPEVGNLNGPAK